MPEPPKNPIFDAASDDAVTGKKTIAPASDAKRILVGKTVPPQPPPKNPIFDAASGGALLGKDSIARASEATRIAALKEALPGLLKRVKAKPRIDQFLPYLLIRSFAGDLGARPFPLATSLATSLVGSPDIWIHAGDPASTPAIPPDRGTYLSTGLSTTVYAHVWNLGRAPVVGATVEFYNLKTYGLFLPSFVPQESALNLLGTAKVDLAPRSSNECHRLVKCPTAWSPPPLQNYILQTAILVTRISGIGDPIGNDPYRPSANRHVAIRAVAVVGTVVIPAQIGT